MLFKHFILATESVSPNLVFSSHTVWLCRLYRLIWPTVLLSLPSRLGPNWGSIFMPQQISALNIRPKVELNDVLVHSCVVFFTTDGQRMHLEGLLHADSCTSRCRLHCHAIYLYSSSQSVSLWSSTNSLNVVLTCSRCAPPPRSESYWKNVHVGRLPLPRIPTERDETASQRSVVDV